MYSSLKCLGCFVSLIAIFFSLSESAIAQTDSINSDFNRGVEALRSDRFEETISIMTRVIDQLSYDPAPLINRGLAYLGQKQYLEAIEDFNAAISVDPRSALAYLNKGVALYKMGNLDQANSAINQAIIFFEQELSVAPLRKESPEQIEQWNQNSDTAYLNRGLIRYDLERYEDAIDDFNFLINKNVVHDQVYLFRGQAYLALGKEELGCQDLQQYERVNPINNISIPERCQRFQ